MVRAAQRGGDLQLLVASAITGVAGASFILLVEWELGLEAFAPIAQLWTIWSISAATLMFAFQQWAIQLGIGRTAALGSTLRGGPTALAAAATIGTAAVTFLTRSSLFHSDSAFWPVAAALVVLGTIFSGLTRGVLAVVNSHSALAATIAGENLVRVAAAIVLIALGGEQWLYGVGLVAGFVMAGFLLMVPAVPAVPVGDAGRGGEVSRLGSGQSPGGSTLGSAAVAGFLSHVAMAGPPLLAAFNGASAASVSTLFVVLTAVRLPHLLLQAGAPRAGVIFQDWVNSGQVAKLRHARLVLAGATLVLAALAALFGAMFGDLLIGSVFGIRGQVEAISYAFMTAAAVLSVGATLATVQMVAEERNQLLIWCWIVPLVTATLAAIVLGVNEIGGLSAGLLLLHLAVLSGLTLVGNRRAEAVVLDVDIDV